MTAEKRKRNDPEIRRAQILDEAIRIVGERGYYGFAVQDLARRCGLTTGGLLYHFGSKELLLLAVLEERDRRDASIIRSSAQSAIEGAGVGQFSRARVIALLHAMMVRSAEQPEIVRLQSVLQSEALDPRHPAHEYFFRREQSLLDIFAQLFSAIADDPRDLARQILALADGLEQQWLRADRAFDIVDQWDRAMSRIFPNRSMSGDG